MTDTRLLEESVLESTTANCETDGDRDRDLEVEREPDGDGDEDGITTDCTDTDNPVITTLVTFICSSSSLS